jgi:ABC-2 type transport system permease protein
LGGKARREAAWLFAAVRAETYKVLRRRMTYITLASLVVLVGLVYVGLWLRLRDGPGTRPDSIAVFYAIRYAVSFANAIPYGLSVERFFATIVAVVFAGTMMGNEYDWRTASVVVSRGVRRWHFLFAKAVVAVGFTAVAVLAGLLAAFAGQAWLTSLYGLPWGDIDAGWAWDAVAGVSRTTFVILPFVFLALLFGNLLKSGGQAVGAALGVFFSEQIFNSLLSIATGWPRDIPKAFFSENIDAVMRENGLSGLGAGPFLIDAGGPSAGRAAVVLFAWGTAFGLMLFWRFQRRDIQE